MFKWFIRLKLAYQLRHLTDDISADHLADLLEVAIKAGRRCTHDMDHCLSYLPVGVVLKRGQAQTSAWRNVFYSSQETKMYLNKHHRRILNNDTEINRLTKLLQEHGHAVSVD